MYKRLIPSIKRIGHLLGKGIIKDRSPHKAGIILINREYKADQLALYISIVISKDFKSCNKINLRLI